MIHIDDALTEAVAIGLSGSDAQDWPDMEYHAVDFFMDQARTAIEIVRAHDEQAALNCGHCTPNTDEIACACQIKERDDE